MVTLLTHICVTRPQWVKRHVWQYLNNLYWLRVICNWCISLDMYMQLHGTGPVRFSASVLNNFYPKAFQDEGGIVVACVYLFVHKLYLVCTIPHYRFELESPNLHQTCILGYSQLVLKMGSLTLTFKVILAIWLRILGNLTCLHKLQWIQATITKFVPNMHPGILSIVLKMEVIDLDLQGHFGHFDLENWLVHVITCDRFVVTKFVPNMHHGIDTAGIEKGSYWPWPSRSYGHFDSEFQETSTLLLHTNLGHQRGVTYPNALLFKVKYLCLYNWSCHILYFGNHAINSSFICQVKIVSGKPSFSDMVSVWLANQPCNNMVVGWWKI